MLTSIEPLCRKIRPVDINLALALLPNTHFIDTGGTNGWIAYPEWLPSFVESLQLEELVTYSVCRKLPAWQGIPPHVDHGRDGDRRYHVPLVTHPSVIMRWPEEDVSVHLEAGFLYEVCFSELHEIVHRAPVDRIHVQVNVTGAK